MVWTNRSLISIQIRRLLLGILRSDAPGFQVFGTCGEEWIAVVDEEPLALEEAVLGSVRFRASGASTPHRGLPRSRDLHLARGDVDHEEDQEAGQAPGGPGLHRKEVAGCHAFRSGP